MDTLKRRMEQLLNGRFEYEVPKLTLSDTQINLTTNEGENVRGELYVAAEDNRRIKGMTMSSNRRVLLAKEKFSGTTVCIPYGLDVKGLSAGETVDAVITINSNLGEYQVPVHAEITDDGIQTSRGAVDNLEAFIKLAESDYREAFRLYTSESFLKVLQGEDPGYESLYRGMSRNPVTYQHMEEFLIGTGKKEPVTLRLEKTEQTWDHLDTTVKDCLNLYKSTWGYTRMEVEVTGDFLEVEKKVITSEDFIGSVYGLEYLIRKEKLGSGRKYGQIRIKTVYGTYIYEVKASGNASYELSTRTYEKKGQAALATLYEKYLLGEIKQQEWKEASLKELENLRNLGCYYPKQQLTEAYIYEQTGDVANAMSVLWPLRELKFTREQMEEEAWYLALAVKTSVATEEQKMTAQARIENLYRMNPGSYPILKVLMETSEEYKQAPGRQMYMLEELFDLGCRSPFLYLAAYEKMETEAGYLKKLSPFMVQVLHYAARYGKLNEELTMRIGHLSEYVKNFQPVIYRLLVKCYEAYPGNDLVDHICKYIMKGQPAKSEYFRWYQLAVEADIRITRLYEYYIETMPQGFQSVLPQVIRMYFVYNNTLSSRKRASVYANVIRNKEADKTTYQNYRKAMEAFAQEALMEGRISEDYATIYQECIEDIATPALGEAMAKVMFSYRVYCDDPKIRSVIVCHGELKEEQSYPCTDGAAYIQLYTPDARILFEDEKRRRYATTVDYNIQKLMDEKPYLQSCMNLDIATPGLLLAVCGNDSRRQIGLSTLGCYQHVVEMSEFQEPYRHMVCRKILEYYAEHAGDDTLDSYLKKMDLVTFAKVDKVLLCEILIEKGMYATALDMISRYGYEGIKTESLMKLTSYLILDYDFVEQEELVYLAQYVFEQGLYNEVILIYLSDNLLGSVEQMALLWERMRGFQLDTYALEEEILLLSMFGRVYLRQGAAMLEQYVAQKGKEPVILAYISFWAYGYFLGKKETDPYIFQCLEQCCRRKQEVDRICHLALLKYYAELDTYTEEQEKLINEILEECTENSLRFAFYRKFPARFTKPYQMDDKQFIQVQYPAGARVTIHYRLIRDKDTGENFKSEPMKNMYQGIFVKEFLLFYDEILEYYLTVELPDDTRQTEKKLLTMEESLQEGNTKYQLINQMLAGRKLGRRDQTEKAMEQYLQREHFARKMFPVLHA